MPRDFRVWGRAHLTELVLVVLAVLVYWPALDNPFVFDDVRTVVTNPSLRGNLEFALVYERFRPLTNLTYFAEFQLWGLSAVGYHATNALLHAVNVLLVYRVARAVHEDDEIPNAAVVTAAMFACHPVMASAAGYVSARSELLMAALMLGSLLSFLRASSWRGVAAGWVLWLVALTAKESAAMLPLLLGAIDLVRGRWRRRVKKFYVPAGALLVAGFVARLVMLSDESSGSSVSGLGTHWLLEAGVVFRYLQLLFWPAGQSLVHQVSATPSAWSVVALLVLLAAATTAITVRRTPAPVRVGVLWFLVALLPSAVIPLAELMAEHRVYVASAGVFLAVGWAVARGWQRMGWRATWRWASLVVLALSLAGLTWGRLVVWGEEETLWLEAVERAPDVYITQATVGQILHKKGDCAGAMKHYRRALELLPERTEARVNLGACLARERQYRQAEVVFREVLMHDPDNVQALNNLGRLAWMRRDPAMAEQFYRRVLELDPDNAVATRGLAEVQ